MSAARDIAASRIAASMALVACAAIDALIDLDLDIDVGTTDGGRR